MDDENTIDRMRRSDRSAAYDYFKRFQTISSGDLVTIVVLEDRAHIASEESVGLVIDANRSECQVLFENKLLNIETWRLTKVNVNDK